MFEKIKQLMEGKKTNTTIALWMVLVTYGESKGFDMEAIKQWAIQFYTHIESLYLLLGTAAIWFRQMGKMKEVKS